MTPFRAFKSVIFDVTLDAAEAETMTSSVGDSRICLII
jgi:hypothetical protein